MGSHGWNYTNDKMNEVSFAIFVVYYSVVGEVEADLKDATDAGDYSYPQLDLRGSVEGYIFSVLRSNKSDQKVMSGFDLAH